MSLWCWPTDRQTGVEVHVLDHQLLAELVGQQLGNLHVHAVVGVAVLVLERLEGRVGRDEKLVLVRVQFGRLDCRGRAVAEVFVADFLKGAVFHNFRDEIVDLREQLGLGSLSTPKA